mgnify:CR=1 FL=1
MFEKYLKKDELITNLQELIKIPSVHSESNNPSEPFGKNTIKALEYTLNLGKKLGFKTKNIDGYCGYIEFGEGTELIGIVGHLDVVPEGENWTYPPFKAHIADNKIYGRGAIDDKGPVIASLYAMKAVMDYCSESNININKRVRLILGLNEERDWKCINYYKQHEESPTIGFSPDADFPCIYAEKGLISPFLIMDYSTFKNEDIVLSDIDCNNNPLNVVPKYCSCIISVKNNININDVTSFIKDTSSKLSFKIDIEILNNNQLKIISHGIQAHAAHPDLGINAISHLIIVLNKLFKIPVSVSMYVFDTLIVLAQFGFSDVRQCLYGIVLIFIYTMVIDKILVMGAQKIEVKIISSKYEEIRKAILTNVDRGVTMLHGQTGYLLENTEVLINVISTRELVQVERLVKSIDEDAFMIISNVHEVQGRGFNLEKEYIEK